jgi:hypothetical protein
MIDFVRGLIEKPIFTLIYLGVVICAMLVPLPFLKKNDCTIESAHVIQGRFSIIENIVVKASQNLLLIVFLVLVFSQLVGDVSLFRLFARTGNFQFFLFALIFVLVIAQRYTSRFAWRWAHSRVRAR